MTRRIHSERPANATPTIAENDFFCQESPRLLAAVSRQYPGLRPEDVEAVVQAACLADLLHKQKHGPFSSEKMEHLWLRKAVAHKAIDWLRRRKKRKTQALDEIAEEPVDGKTPGAANFCLTIEAREWLAVKLAQLAKKDSFNAWLLMELCLKERPIKELAAEAHLTVQAIKNRKTRLKAILKEWGLADWPAREALP